MTVAFISEPTAAERAPPPAAALASRGFAPPDLLVVVFGRDTYPAAEDSQETQNSPSPTAVVSDPTQHALLYGRYLGQVQARIERAWMRPRTEIGAPTFSCRARIAQDRGGDVVEVKFDNCSGSERWQQSLLSAIRTASPLPAPPDPSVYADTLSLSFRSEAFNPGGPTEGFEPDNRAPFLAGDRYRGRESFENFESRGRDGSKVIHLTIIGKPNTASEPLQLVSPPISQPPPDGAAESSPSH